MSLVTDRSVFTDTSAFYAMLDRDDQWHSEAVKGFHRLAVEKRFVHTTNLVVAETYTLALVRLGYAIANGWLGAINNLNVMFQNSVHHQMVGSLLERYQGQGFSYTDAFSFVAMEAIGTRTAFAFDRHFQDYGWEVFPEPL